MNIRRYPFLSFIVNDNPYHCRKNGFKYRLHIPIQLFLRDHNKITSYTMINDINNLNFNHLYSSINDLIKNHTINNQTLSIDKKSIELDYLLPVVIDTKNLNNSVIVPNQKSPVNYKNICNMDVFIPFKLEDSGLFINKPIWSRN